MPTLGATSTLATPAPGTAMPITQPSPNPVQYNFTPNTTASSSQVNSNNWKIYNDLNATIAALNSCSYSTGPGVTSVVATAPIVATIGSCVPGVGTQLTLSLSGGTSPSSASNFAASNASNAYTYQGAGSFAGNALSIGSTTTLLAGVNCNGFQLQNVTTAINLFCIDNNGTGSFAGSLYINGAVNGTTGTYSGNITSGGTVTGANVVATGTLQGANSTVTGTAQAAYTNITNTAQSYNENVSNLAQLNNVKVTGTPQEIVSGTPFQIPYIAEATSGTGHIEHGFFTATSMSGFACTTQSFNVPFSAKPATAFTLESGTGFSNFKGIYDQGTSTSVVGVCVYGSYPDGTVLPLAWIAIGE